SIVEGNLADAVTTSSGASASGRGGGVFVAGGTLALDRSTLVANTASGHIVGWGGGLGIDAESSSSATVSIDQCTISGNVATTGTRASRGGQGGGIHATRRYEHGMQVLVHGATL